MSVNSLPKAVTRQRSDGDLNPGPSALESSTLTTRLPSHPKDVYETFYNRDGVRTTDWFSRGKVFSLSAARPHGSPLTVAHH